jgi:ubiquinone/menaquinone biosynthesis C-methylase UbiE
MANELGYRDEAAAEYDRAFAHVSSHFLPFLLNTAGVEPGMKALDIATGTGLAAAECLRAVGASGRVVAADMSEAILEKAKQRLSSAPNVTFAVEDGQALTFVDSSFDALICSLGLMFFPDPALGLLEFLRVLRPEGRAAASVLTAPERSYNGRINAVIAKQLPSIGEATAKTFLLGDAAHLRQLLESAGFRNVKISRQTHRFRLPSFDAYFRPFERGGASTGQAYLTLPQSARDAVRKEVQASLGDTGGPVEVEVEFQFAKRPMLLTQLSAVGLRAEDACDGRSDLSSPAADCSYAICGERPWRTSCANWLVLVRLAGQALVVEVRLDPRTESSGATEDDD